MRSTYISTSRPSEGGEYGMAIMKTCVVRHGKLRLGVPENLKDYGKCDGCEVGKHTGRGSPKGTGIKATSPSSHHLPPERSNALYCG